MKKLNVFEVEIYCGGFFSRVKTHDVFLVAAEDTRQARRVAIDVGEDEGLLKRREIRKTAVLQRPGIIYGAR